MLNQMYLYGQRGAYIILGTGCTTVDVSVVSLLLPSSLLLLLSVIGRFGLEKGISTLK